MSSQDRTTNDMYEDIREGASGQRKIGKYYNKNVNIKFSAHSGFLE